MDDPFNGIPPGFSDEDIESLRQFLAPELPRDTFKYTLVQLIERGVISISDKPPNADGPEKNVDYFIGIDGPEIQILENKKR